MTDSIALVVDEKRAQSWEQALGLAGFEVVCDERAAEAQLAVVDGSSGPGPANVPTLSVPEDEEIVPERVIALVAGRLEAIRRERFAAGVDPVTGMPGRENLFTRVENEVELSARIMKPFAVAILDPNGLDSLAAGLGPEAADRALSEFAQFVRQRLRRVDGVGRWGSEEIALVMPATYPTQAMTVISRLQDHLAGNDPAPGRIRSFTAAVAAYPIDADSAKRLMDLAEKRLADARRKGDGRIVMV